MIARANAPDESDFNAPRGRPRRMPSYPGFRRADGRVCGVLWALIDLYLSILHLYSVCNTYTACPGSTIRSGGRRGGEVVYNFPGMAVSGYLIVK